jgi:hypothetical protein
MIPYFDTTHLPEPQLSLAFKAATDQNAVIEMIYLCARSPLSPSQVWQKCPKRNGEPLWPITSIRRGINTLTKEGKLTKLDTQVKGHFGRAEHLWRMNVNAYGY